MTTHRDTVDGVTLNSDICRIINVLKVEKLTRF